MMNRPMSSNRPAGAPSSELGLRKIVPNSQAMLDPIKSTEAVVKKPTVRAGNVAPVIGLHGTSVPSQ